MKTRYYTALERRLTRLAMHGSALDLLVCARRLRRLDGLSTDGIDRAIRQELES